MSAIGTACRGSALVSLVKRATHGNDSLRREFCRESTIPSVLENTHQSTSERRLTIPSLGSPLLRSDSVLGFVLQQVVICSVGERKSPSELAIGRTFSALARD